MHGGEVKKCCDSPNVAIRESKKSFGGSVFPEK